MTSPRADFATASPEQRESLFNAYWRAATFATGVVLFVLMVGAVAFFAPLSVEWAQAADPIAVAAFLALGAAATGTINLFTVLRHIRGQWPYNTPAEDPTVLPAPLSDEPSAA